VKALKLSEGQVKELRAAYALLGQLLAAAEGGGGRVTERVREAKPAGGIGAQRFLLALRAGTTKVPEETGQPASYYATVAKLIGQAGVTEEQATRVGRWIEEQHWLKGPVPLRQVAFKWPEWHTKAKGHEEAAAKADVPDTALWREL
jgi:hypothetical protein